MSIRIGKGVVNKTLHNTTELKAWKYVEKKLEEADDGKIIKPSRKTVEQVCKEWLAHVARQGIKETTLDSYSNSERFFIRPALGEIPLSKLTTPKIQKAFDELVDQGLAAFTIRNARRVLVRTLSYAVKMRELKENPALDIETPKSKRKKLRAMNEDEAAGFLVAARENPADLIFIFALCTGLRPVEFIGLQWSNLELVREFDLRQGQEFERGLAHIRRTIIRPKGGGWKWSDPKTESGIRDVLLPCYYLSRSDATQSAAGRVQATDG